MLITQICSIEGIFDIKLTIRDSVGVGILSHFILNVGYCITSPALVILSVKINLGNKIYILSASPIFQSPI